MHSKAFGRRIRGIRKAKGYSQVELARLTGLNQSYLSKIESGDDPPPAVQKVYALADALGLDRDELLALSGRPTGRPADDDVVRHIQIAAAIRALLPLEVGSVEIIEALIEILQVMNRIVGGSHAVSADRKNLTTAYHRFQKEAASLDRKTRQEILDSVKSLVQKRTGVGL